MRTYYFTFGFGQPNEGCFTVIKAKTREEARDKMIERYGLVWAFQYDVDSWFDRNGISQQELYNLKEI